ncbi:DNA-binding response regulator, NarL/FixJ family, contains REC and HTH domains [Nocardioides scoriae]|uniref:DNA-binding response regulator, NarL/FixJ family, contains REC and HTH domains n=1 Tax=Nocardioides scoriae TaxID=642780 RepID=A0A1H1WI38_9ACTN|nr:response regulator transcription factor [Nocardioides scoriae]SDS96764.1 DNA-binding response regulator, NarL/FixJ family, contains REC and HTH domains [Nocardioides scoriae]
MNATDDVQESDTSPTRVLVVDDHEVLATSLSMVLDAEPDLTSVGVARSLEQARTLVRSTQPDVLLLDHRLPDGDGVSAIPELRALREQMHVVVLTATAADHVLVAAIEAGASGFVSKTRGLAEVTAAVRAAASGEALISPEMLARLLPRLTRSSGARHQELTDREHEVLGLLARGMTNAAIAAQLVVSVHTVRNHIANLSAKLGAHSKLEALSIAVREGLLPDR